MSGQRNQKRLALLIDGDNASKSTIPGILSEISIYGVLTVRRIYGDWTAPNLQGWKSSLLDHSISPVQQFRYTNGKNATDSALIIDAMDLLFAGQLDGFCLVSSDSDFTRLASRIRESGLVVYGFGERKTPTPFVRACDKFTYVDILNDRSEHSDEPKRFSSTDSELSHLLKRSVDAKANEEGWADLAAVGSWISSQKPEFDSREYGFPKLSALVESLSSFEMDRRDVGNGHKVYLVKNRRSPKA